MVKKYQDEDGKAQVREIVITTKHLFNLDSNARIFIKRKVPLERIYAISLSLASNEFIVHIKNSDDYDGDCRFVSRKNRTKILSHLFNEIIKNTNRKVNLYFHEEKDLYRY